MSTRDLISELADAWGTLDDTAKETGLAALLGVELVHGPGRSRLGGQSLRMRAMTPWGEEPLADGDPWSRVVGNRQLVASIDLTEAAGVDGYPAELPTSGTLHYFYDNESAYAFDQDPADRFRVLRINDGEDTVELVAPEGMPTWTEVALLPVQKAAEVRAAVDAELREPHWAQESDPSAMRDLIWELASTGGHRLGGQPRAVQNDPAVELLYHGDYAPLLEQARRLHDSAFNTRQSERMRAGLPVESWTQDPVYEAIVRQIAVEARNWSHYLTIDEDPAAGMTWGDCGTLYLLHRTLSQGVTCGSVFQCC